MVKLLLFISGVYVVLVLVLYLLQRDLIYYPLQDPPDPANAGVPEMTVVRLATADNLVLRAWYRAPLLEELPTIVYFHGNAGHIGHRAFLVKPYLDQGFGVLLLTYRGYSGNPGTPTEEGLYQDGRAAIEFLQHKERGERCLVLHGTSIGAAVAVQMALEYPIEGLILQSPFTSLPDVGKYHYPFLPVAWLAQDRYDSLEKAGRVQVPVLIMHGEEDRIIPSAFSRRLAEALSGQVQTAFFPHKGHNDLFEPEMAIEFIRRICGENKGNGSPRTAQSL